MEAVLWYGLTGTRGAQTHTRILRAIDHRQRNANQPQATLDRDYQNVRHHLDVLLKHGISTTKDQD